MTSVGSIVILWRSRFSAVPACAARGSGWENGARVRGCKSGPGRSAARTSYICRIACTAMTAMKTTQTAYSIINLAVSWGRTFAISCPLLQAPGWKGSRQGPSELDT